MCFSLGVPLLIAVGMITRSKILGSDATEDFRNPDQTIAGRGSTRADRDNWKTSPKRETA